ncbi:flavoprotein subunit p-cresol methylhydroxylase [Coccidioides immitis H538.4]|uniref:Flavoprotein subunit p-cresol methylhydroxylase n=1 Tax=Coccidioides immitis H538.4 TaxID=396776 RepID=A0A0J8S195_COCIT|nr:flavoprotein subunit p-cresol methylhydroxylase [Coccidioides immitis H538.4]
MAAYSPLSPFSLALNEKENGMANEVLSTWQTTASRTPTLDILPPGVDAETWTGVLEEFKRILGDKGVLSGHEHRIRYIDPYAEESDEQEKRGSSATLFPVTVEHIQAILKICNEHKIPLWTVSRGKNLGYEVTIFDIYRAIHAQKKNIWCSVPALGWGSVVGNALDRGWGYTPAGDHSNQICGIEVVLADGTIVRTGAGAIDNSPCWPLFRGGYGPTYESMFSQSNFGIVTKLTLWASPSPEGFMACRVDVESEDDLLPLIDGFRDLLLHDVIQNHPLIGNLPREMVKRGQRKDFYDGKDAIPDARLKKIQKQFGIGFWSARFGLLMALKAVEYRGKDGGHISFSPVLPPEGSCALSFYRDAKPLCARYGFDYFGGLHLYPRHLTMINMIYFDRTSDTERANASKLFVELVHLARKHGYSEYRAHIDYMDLVAEQYDFNGCSLRDLNERIKDTLDPNGILSPGKQGIWPAQYRQQKEEVSDMEKAVETLQLAN